MISSMMRYIHSSRFGRSIRDRIAGWPGYQQVPQSEFKDKLKMKVRALLSLLSETLRMESFVRDRIRVTRHLRGSYKGETLLIGNGPSANSLTIEQINRFRSCGGKIAVMNSFFRMPLSKLILPDFYFIGDPEFWSPVHEANMSFGENFVNYISTFAPNCTIVQPAHQPPIISGHPKYLFADGRSVAGLIKWSRPDKPWGLPSSIAMVAIATLKFLGFSRIYFTGLDSNMHNHFFIDYKNQINFDTNTYYSYSDGTRSGDRQETGATGVQPVINDPIRHMADLLYAQGIFLNDLYSLCNDICINVGSDSTNDAAPRACLLS